MNLDALRIPAIRDDQESLTATVLSLFPDGNDEVIYDNVNAALGLCMLTAAREEGAGPLEWRHLGRDMHLKDAASLFGMRLRELHPPDAAQGLSRAPQYRIHFVDSYRPLIRIALNKGQPVLAWQGWDAQGPGRWGIITQTSGGEFGLSGVVSADRTPEPLVLPPTQCYVVEQAVPVLPSDTDLIRCAIDNAADSISNRIAAETSIATGTAAYDIWQASITEASPEDLEQHRLFACTVVSNRKSAQRFCESHVPTAAEAALNRLTALAECAKRTIQAFTPFCEAGPSSDQVMAIKALNEAITDTREAELEVAKVIA